MEIIDYVLKPQIKKAEKPRLINFIQLIFCYILILIPLSILTYAVCANFNITHQLFVNNTIGIILFGVFIAPIYEEILFRLLLKFDKKNIIIFFFTITLLIFLAILRSKFFYVSVLTLFLILSVSFVVIKKNQCRELVQNSFKFFYWGSSILFGALHATNFSGNIYLIILFSLLLGAPQIVLGLILGYIRISYGFLYGVFFHIIINSMLLLNLFKR